MLKAKAILIIIFLAIAGLAVWFFGSYKNSGPSPSNNLNTAQPTPVTQAFVVTKTDVPSNALPQSFPSDIPIEAGAQITQNYNASTPGGLLQATRVFTSQQSMAANFKLYSDYLKNNGWAVGGSANNNNIKILSATKVNGSLQITITPGSGSSNSSSVSINYSQQN